MPRPRDPDRTPPVRVSLYLPPALAAWLKAQARRSRRSINEQAISYLLQEQKRASRKQPASEPAADPWICQDCGLLLAPDTARPDWRLCECREGPSTLEP